MLLKNKFWLYHVILMLFLSSCEPKVSSRTVPGSLKISIGTKAGCASAHPLATKVGIEIMQKGGNAIDAAIAVQAALAVVYPRAGNFGGGGFMIYRNNNGETYALDFRERAPLGSDENQFIDDFGVVIPNKSTLGIGSVGIPGTPDGILKMHTRFATLSLEDLLTPAYELAFHGFPITENEAHRLNTTMDLFNIENPNGHPFKKNIWRKGDLLIQKELAQSIKDLQMKGLRDFYEGELSNKIIQESKRRGGVLRIEDLENYQAIWREPIVFSYKDRTLITMPLPSSGGIALAQIFNAHGVLNKNSKNPTSLRQISSDVEIFKQVYRDRITLLGDSDFVTINMDSLLSKEVASKMVDRILTTHDEPESDFQYTKSFIMESYETTHLSILDEWGNAVAITTTLNSNYGSKVWVEGTGILLNNQMDDFSTKPGELNQFGLMGGVANKIEPAKRMLSSMSPTLVLKGNSLELIIGSPGGSTIITTVYRIVKSLIDNSMHIEEALQLPRYHHQLIPDEIVIEKNKFSSGMKDSLEMIGYTYREVDYIGLVNAIQIRGDSIISVSDTRGDDSCYAY